MKSNTTNEFVAAGQPWSRTLFVVLLTFLPLFIYWMCVYAIWPWRYCDSFDPEGIHYAGGLSILRGYGPGNVDNPATPLQTLSAILCLFSGCGILDLESFRPIAYAVIVILQFAAACVFSRFVLRDLPVTWQIALLWLPWLAPDFAFMSRQWCPETLYFPLGILAVVALDLGFRQPSQWSLVFLAGAAIGMMIGVKFIFVAWAVAAFIAFAISHPPKTIAQIWLALAAGLAVGFVAATLPALTRYPHMFEWLLALASKTGQYGSGSPGILDLGRVRVNLIEILLHQKTWTLLVVCIVTGLLFRKPRTGVAIFCALAILGSYALALKHFAPRYLAPTGLILTLAAVALVRDRELTKSRWSGTRALVLIGLLLGKTLWFDVCVHRAFVSERRESERVLNQFLHEHGRSAESVVLYGWRAFVPAFTVRFMNQGESHRFNNEAERAFPCEGLINSWPDGLWYPAGKSSWDFIVVGKEFVDREGLRSLRQHYPSWDVNRYIVIKNDGTDPSPPQKDGQSRP